MHLVHLNITELPRPWFTDHRISRLHITDCGLRNVAAICLIKELYFLQLDGNRLEGVPTCLSSAKVLLWLQVLELSDNKICDVGSLSRHTLPHLKYLKEFTLGQNCISVIPKLLSSKSHIRRLVLRSNKVTNVAPGAFHHLVQLTSLDLSGNSIANLSGSYFARHSVLEVLNLSKNNIAAISTLFNRIRSIKEINLSFNRIVDISVAFNGLTELRVLLLKSNKISSIPDGTFQDNIRLVRIDLTSNDIAWIGRNAFKGLLTLKMLRLHRNRITSLNFSASNLPELQYFGASHNAILRLENGEFRNNAVMTAISLEQNKIAYVERAFVGTTGLRSLNLAGNQVQLLRRSDFALKIAGSAAVTINSYVSTEVYNPLICDCRLAWLMEEDSGIRVRGMAACAKPWWLEGRPVRVLHQEDFSRWKKDCQPGCRCECHEGSLGGREINVNCSSATVVNTLDLRRNNLQQLPLLLVTQLNLTSIWLSGNEYACECADYSFKQWIEGHRNVIRDASDIVCGQSHNPLVSGKKFITLGQHDLCPATLPQGAVYVLLACGLLVVLLGLSATYLRYKDVIRTWLRVHGVCGWACWDVEDDTQKLFDVFVSFSSKDIDFIHDEILPELDAMGISYCTYERNFKGGYLLQDIIRDAVACSRRTLLVLTRNFVESEWCRLEFRMAHQRALEDNINRLVIVLVEELELNVLDKDLRLYVRGANYLRWGEPNFWDRMLHSLATREAEERSLSRGSRGRDSWRPASVATSNSNSSCYAYMEQSYAA
ncbi:hypothetical protein HPB50_021209 [Hyalomma asiaticum]|uniref:Uncharacterized protein n=1 Tax=Hyalomma asiaticum TaxID=266040 RepID=A0ACB7S1N1_HYAAI|nr:hypothetical protein HPB50_021209 [Hyalomma asiaticum]